jgi:hypothetical protein
MRSRVAGLRVFGGMGEGVRCPARAAAPFGAILVLLVSCTPVPLDEPPAPRPFNDTVTPADGAADLVPAGFGSLRQDDFSVELMEAGLHVKVTPLAEEVIRLAAPDTYDRLHALARSRAEAADQLTDAPASDLFLVSFFSRDPNVEYRPDELQLTHRGRTLRPAGIVPLTTGWGRHLLQPQQTQSAIYVFEPDFDYGLPITVRYGLRQSDEWHRDVIQRLDDERTRVISRAQASDRGG